jgi:hypothetical protein
LSEIARAGRFFKATYSASVKLSVCLQICVVQTKRSYPRKQKTLAAPLRRRKQAAFRQAASIIGYRAIGACRE